MTDLALASSQELVDELMKRMDTAVFIGLAHDEVLRTKGQQAFTRRCQGELFRCLGLAQFMEQAIKNDIVAGLNATGQQPVIAGDVATVLGQSAFNRDVALGVMFGNVNRGPEFPT
jgi:hypothetical protein